MSSVVSGGQSLMDSIQAVLVCTKARTKSLLNQGTEVFYLYPVNTEGIRKSCSFVSSQIGLSLSKFF